MRELAVTVGCRRRRTWIDHNNERGEVTAQTVIWVAIAAAGAFAVAVILYNKFRTKANAVDLDNPGVLPAG